MDETVLKDFSDDNLNEAEMMMFVWHRKENVVAK